MKAEHAAYGRAQAKVAETREAYEQALADLEDVSAPLADQIDRVWDANQQALAAAAGQVTTAVENLARVEIEAGTAARARARGGMPVLTDDEVALIEAAAALVAEAKQAHADAKDAFKAGVTAELLDALGG